MSAVRFGARLRREDVVHLLVGWDSFRETMLACSPRSSRAGPRLVPPTTLVVAVIGGHGYRLCRRPFRGGGRAVVAIACAAAHFRGGGQAVVAIACATAHFVRGQLVVELAGREPAQTR